VIKTIILSIVLIVIALAPAAFAQALTAEKAAIAVWQEEFKADYATAATTIAMTLSYDGDGTAGTIEVTAGGASIEVTIDGASHADLSYPDGNNGINVQAYFDAGNTLVDLVAFIDSSDDFTCVIGENMPPWIADDAKIKVMAAAAWTLTADVDLPAGFLIAVKGTGATNRSVLSRAHKTYQTFSAGCTLDLYEYNSSDGATRIMRYPVATTVTREKNNDEYRVDASSGSDAYFILDYSASDAPNAADYIYYTYSIYRR